MKRLCVSHLLDLLAAVDVDPVVDDAVDAEGLEVLDDGRVVLVVRPAEEHLAPVLDQLDLAGVALDLLRDNTDPCKKHYSHVCNVYSY